MRPMWSGMISFGLVNIPVKLYTAVKSSAFEMNYLRRDDLCPIQYKRVCRRTGEEVPYENIVRGYEYRKDDYVVLDDRDFEKADLKKTYTIDIEVFIDERDVGPEYFEKPYFLEPDKRAHKTYALFRQAMVRAGKVGIGKFVLKDREHLVMLRPDNKVITLILMRFSELLKNYQELDLPGEMTIPKNQLALALELIGKLQGRFKPRDYRDTYSEQLKKVIEAKKRGKTFHIEKPKPEITEVRDIMVKLRQSLSAAKKEHVAASVSP